MDDLQLNFEWSKDGFGSIMMLDGKITNNGPTAIKDIQIECVSTASSGTKIDKNKGTLYELIEAGKTHKFSRFNMGFLHSQAQGTACSIVKFARP